MIEIRLSKVVDPKNFDTLYQLIAIVGDEGIGESVVFKASGGRASLVEGLLNLAAAVERA
jgi:hypothetical protein